MQSHRWPPSAGNGPEPKKITGSPGTNPGDPVIASVNQLDGVIVTWMTLDTLG